MITIFAVINFVCTADAQTKQSPLLIVCRVSEPLHYLMSLLLDHIM